MKIIGQCEFIIFCEVNFYLKSLISRFLLTNDLFNEVMNIVCDGFCGFLFVFSPSFTQLKEKQRPLQVYNQVLVQAFQGGEIQCFS